jgi:nucleoside-diphosphate-sugar epimerase
VRKSQNHFFGLAIRDLEHILRHAKADLGELRGKKLFITGGTGFFGKWLLAGLLFANDELSLGLNLTVLSRNPGGFEQIHPEMGGWPGLTFVRGNVADFKGEGRDADYIIHAATDTTSFTSEPDERERSRAIVRGTRNMLGFTRRTHARMLNISSGAVYGPAAGKISGATEDDYLTSEPAMPYGEAKREAEQLCLESEVDFVTARAFAFLGPYLPLDTHFAAGNFLRDAMRGGPILVRGNGTAMRSYLYPADLVVWLLRILIRGQRHRAYNVGSDEAVTTAQLARLIAESAEPKAEVIIQSTQPQGPQNIYLPNIARAREELDLDMLIPLPEAIARTIAFLK